MRVVGSLTTTLATLRVAPSSAGAEPRIPSKISELEDTLQSIINQSHKLDAIYLNIPYQSETEDEEYNIPHEYNDYCDIVRGQDYGPITKIVGPLLNEQDPDTIIITFDDDKIYPEGLVEKLLSKHKIMPNAAIGSAGLKIGAFPFYISSVHNNHRLNDKWYAFFVGNSGELVDVLFSAPGALYMRKFFPSKDRLDKLLRYTMNNEHLFNKPDVVISGYLCKRSIEKRIYKMQHVEGKENNAQITIAILRALYSSRNMFKERVGYDRNNTMTYPLFMLFMAMIFLGALFSMKNR